MLVLYVRTGQILQAFDPFSVKKIDAAIVLEFFLLVLTKMKQHVIERVSYHKTNAFALSLILARIGLACPAAIPVGCQQSMGTGQLGTGWKTVSELDSTES